MPKLEPQQISPKKYTDQTIPSDEIYYSTKQPIKEEKIDDLNILVYFKDRNNPIEYTLIKNQHREILIYQDNSLITKTNNLNAFFYNITNFGHFGIEGLKLENNLGETGEIGFSNDNIQIFFDKNNPHSIIITGENNNNFEIIDLFTHNFKHQIGI